MTIVEDSINNNLCLCGCGQYVDYNKYKFRPTKFVKGHHARGKCNPRWNGGKRLHDKGYVRVWKPEHPYASNDGYVYEHRLVMETFIGRYMTKDEIIHHINGKKNDNRIENLKLLTKSQHSKLHYETEQSYFRRKNTKQL